MAVRRSQPLLQGTLDLLILQTLALGPLHGHGIARHIQRRSEGVLLVEHGSLYPALQRLGKRGWIASRWERAAGGRELKRYRLTRAGRRQLAVETSRWADLVRAVGRLIAPV